MTGVLSNSPHGGRHRSRSATWRALPEGVLPGLLLAVAFGYFALAAGHAIDVPGLQYDEVLFVNAATGEPTNGLFVAKRILGVPVMLMGYIGALKAYLYYPIFQLFGVSPATIRWPVIGVSLVTLWLTYGVARFSFPRMASALLTLVVAVDPAFIYMSKLDYGPVALMLLLKLLALWFMLRAVSRGSSRDLWGVCAACALGMFDKLNFIWFVLALLLAGATLFRAELSRMYRRDRRGFVIPLVCLAIVVGAATVRLVVPQLVASQSAQQVTLVDRIPYVVHLYARTMSGRELFRFVTGSELTATTVANLLTGISLIAVLVAGGVAARRAGGLTRLRLRHRIIAFHLLVFLLIALQIWITKKAWGPHHLMMLYPLQYLILFAVTVTLLRGPGTALVTVALIASHVSVGRAYDRAFRAGAEFEPQWSPVLYDLVAYLDARRPDRIVSVDWGIHNQVFALGTAHTRAASRDRWPQFRALGDTAEQMRIYREDVLHRNALAILHARGWENMPTVRANFFAWASSLGVTLAPDSTFTSPGGATIFEVYWLKEPASRGASFR